MEQPEDSKNTSDLHLLTEQIRERMTGKIVHAVVPNPDINAPYDSRMVEFQEYAKFLERKAFEKVTTRDEYYAALAAIIFRMQKKLRNKPPPPANDREWTLLCIYRNPSFSAYYNIPPSHQLADFVGLTQEELEEFDDEQHPQTSVEDPAMSKTCLTVQMRLHVADKLGSMLFPAPDAFAKHDGRMDTINQKLREIEAEAYDEAEDKDDYYNRASYKAYRLHKTMKRNGESYLDRMFDPLG